MVVWRYGEEIYIGSLYGSLFRIPYVIYIRKDLPRQCLSKKEMIFYLAVSSFCAIFADAKMVCTSA